MRRREGEKKKPCQTKLIDEDGRLGLRLGSSLQRGVSSKSFSCSAAEKRKGPVVISVARGDLFRDLTNTGSYDMASGGRQRGTLAAAGADDSKQSSGSPL